MLWRPLVLALALVGSASAWAGGNDFQLYQLGNPIEGAAGYSARANGNFQAFARELGAGISAAVLEPPTSLGVDGFSVTGELSVVGFSTRSASFLMPTQRAFPGTWLMPGLHVRKGLPFSFEVGARATWLGDSGMAAAGVDAKWTLNEGQQGYWPAVSVRGTFTKLFNTPDFDLATGDIDLSVGKRFVVGGVAKLTPYLGYALGWVSATTGIIDFDRGRSTADSERNVDDTFENMAQLRSVAGGDNSYNRFYLGGQAQLGVFVLGVEGSVSSVGSFGEPLAEGGASTTDVRNLPAVLAFNASFGVDF